MTNEMLKVKQVFKDIADKVGKAGKAGYMTAVSSINASKHAGKITVLKMEIASRKMKMQKLFCKLGEIAYRNNSQKTVNLFQDTTARGLLEEIRTYENEITEIERHMKESSDALEALKTAKENDAIDDIDDVKETFNDTEKQDKVPWTDIIPGRHEIVKAALSETQKPSGISKFSEELKAGDKDVRIRALKGLFRHDGTDAIPYIVKCLNDRESEVRRRAASYLGWKMAVSAAPKLILVARDKDSSVRKASFEALGELGTKEAVPELIKGLDDQDNEVRKSAYKSLTKVTNEFIEFSVNGSLSERFKGIQRWEKWWKNQEKK